MCLYTKDIFQYKPLASNRKRTLSIHSLQDIAFAMIFYAIALRRQQINIAKSILLCFYSPKRIA